MPVQVFGLIKWPAAVPVQVHYGNSDPYKDDSAVSTLRAQVEASGSAFRSYGYPVAGHLFADPDLPSYEEPSADAMLEAWLELPAETRTLSYPPSLTRASGQE